MQMLRLRWSLAGILLVALVPGCGAARNGTMASEAHELFGQWRRVSIASATQSATCPATLSLPGGITTSCGEKDTIEFRPDGTFAATFSDSPVRGVGTWRLNGNNLVLTFTAPPSAAGSTHSTTVTFANSGKITNNATLLGAPTTDTYDRL
jgi:hypothetical protein